MDLGLSDEQHELVASFATLLSKASAPEQVRSAEPGGYDEDLWGLLLGTGALTMAVPAGRGGWGASLLDLALVAELIGRNLAPAPVIEAQVAARLLATVATPDALDSLQSALDGDRLVTLALHPPREGVARLTPAGAVCDAVVTFDGVSLCLTSVEPRARRPVANLGAAPLADLSLTGSVELAAGPGAAECFEVATDEWLVLTAAALVGLSAVAHERVSAYARERRAFGSVVGSYQGVAHPLADDATNIDGARLLVREAAWALGSGRPRGRELAAMAFAFASETAERATYHGIHFHGGYGFMLEHDVQLFYRRARGWARVWGDAEAGYRRAADARYGPAVEAGD
jgi:alkylation response protein AidB-like acyl-CoA dehydrogenase